MLGLNHSRKLLDLMAKKRIDESPRRLKESSTVIQLQEHASDDGVGKQEKRDRKMSKLLIEANPVKLDLVESKGDKLVVRGEFARVGVPTKNGRIYTKKVMSRAIDQLEDEIKNRRVWGTIDHPKDGKTSIWDVSHVITGLNIEGDVVIGEAEILRNTRGGKQIEALIGANIPIPVSSRGLGSTKPSADPKMEGEIVQDDFILKTWDFVSDPAVTTAVPMVVNEDVEYSSDLSQMFLDEFPEISKTLQEDAVEKAKLKVNKGVDDVVKEAEEKLRLELTEKFEKQLAKALIEAKEDLSENLREEFGADPEVGAARAVLSAVWEMVAPFKCEGDEKAKIDADKARELEFAEVSGRAIKAECMEHIERQIGGHPMAESIRKLIKGQEFSDLEDAKGKLKAIMDDLPDVTSEGFVSRDELELREKNASMKEKLLTLTGRVEQLSVKLEEAVEVGLKADTQSKDAESRALEIETDLEEANAKIEQMNNKIELAEEMIEVEKYKCEMVAKVPNGRKLLGLMESANSKAMVDEAVKDVISGGVTEKQLNESREEIARGVGGFLVERKESNENNLFGDDMAHWQKMAGVNEQP